MMIRAILLVVCTTLLASAYVHAAPAGPSVLALDFGHEFLKGCLANQKSSTIGTHLDVVINEQSARKTPNILGFDGDDERIIGDSALPLLFRSPARVFPMVKRLLGKTLSDPATARYAADFPSLKLEAAGDRATVQFAAASANVDSLSVEEVTVMLLQLAKRQAENHVAANAEPEDVQPVTRVVLTVPESWEAGQRILLSQLARLAGFDAPDAVIGELTAVAVDFAVRNVVLPGTTRMAFLGAGTMGVSASLVELERVGVEGAEDAEIRVKVLRTASDDSIGGYSFDVLLRDELARRFDTAHKGAESITTSPRAMAKLLRESREIKEMLSVSPVIETTIEELWNGKDFKLVITQDEFRDLSAGLVSRLIAPLSRVLDGQGDLSTLSGLEIFGGCVRVPAVQNSLRASFPTLVLGKHVDGDEGALVGAAHYAGVRLGIRKLIKVSIDESAVLTSTSSLTLELSPIQEGALRDRIASLDAKAASRRAADASRNGLESALNDARDLLASPVATKKRTESEALEAQITIASSFVDDSDKNTSAADFDAQLTQLRQAMLPLQTPKKVVPVEKPSAPRKKRDRRAEHKKAMEDAAKRAKKAQDDAKKTDTKKPEEKSEKDTKKSEKKKAETKKPETKKTQTKAQPKPAASKSKSKEKASAKDEL